MASLLKTGIFPWNPFSMYLFLDWISFLLYAFLISFKYFNSLGLDPTNYSAAAFGTEFSRKIDADINAYVAYITNKINTENLGTHSFYFYICLLMMLIMKSRAL